MDDGTAHEFRQPIGTPSMESLQLSRCFAADVTRGDNFSFATATTGDKFAVVMCAIADCAPTLGPQRRC
jgi:hypothetical protein